MEMLSIVEGAINPTELPDFEPDDKIIYSISAGERIKLDVKKAKTVVYERYSKLREKYENTDNSKLREKYGTYSSVKIAFFKLKEQLIQEGKEPKKYD